MKARIYQVSKSATQSGRGKTALWMLEYELESQRRPESLMGWTASDDTMNQVRLKFASQDEAVAFAIAKGIDYTVTPAQSRIVTPRNYVDNFKYRPVAEKASNA
ncbi:MAG TPA: ETC complex I subunit [Alphaproteobacteria bacterium]